MQVEIALRESALGGDFRLYSVSFFRSKFLMQIEYSVIGEILVTLYHKREEPSLPKMMIVHGGRAVMIFVAAPRQAKQASLEPTICYCHRI